MAMIYALGCACDVLLAKIRLCKLNSLIQLWLLLLLVVGAVVAALGDLPFFS
jgi:hypothetical protein